MSQQRRAVALARRVPVPVDVAIRVLAEDPEAVLRSRIGIGHVAREVRVGYGPFLEDDGVVAVPVWWEDSEHPELFPTFDGGLELRAAAGGGTELVLAGSYRPPFGAVGRFADGVLGHRIVTASLEAFLTAAAERLSA